MRLLTMTDRHFLRTRVHTLARVTAAMLVVSMAGPASARKLETRFLYSLADLNGVIRSSWVTLAYDRSSHELLVADISDGAVRVYRENGMEEQRIGGDEEVGNIAGVAVNEAGDLFILASKEGRIGVVHTDFRGQFIARLELQGMPEGFAEGFVPSGIRYGAGKLFLVDHVAMKVLVTDETGSCLASYDMRRLIKFEAKDLAAVVMRSFNVDASGNLLFTVSSLFTVYIVSPSGEIRNFGTKGSTPGKFNIVGGVATDEHGNFFVTDLLRAVVMVFDPKFEFIGEFGYRGWGPGNLISPLDLLVTNGLLYVAQAGRRGVSVFRVAIRDSEG